MWGCWLGLLLLLLAGQAALEARRSRWRRELAPGLHLRGIRDAGGRYCQEQDMCCRGRADECALPYLGATCYCDLFCNRTVSDCCPDFWDFCLGIPPPSLPSKGACMGAGSTQSSEPTGTTAIDAPAMREGIGSATRSRV